MFQKLDTFHHITSKYVGYNRKLLYIDSSQNQTTFEFSLFITLIARSNLSYIASCYNDIKGMGTQVKRVYEYNLSWDNWERRPVYKKVKTVTTQVIWV